MADNDNDKDDDQGSEDPTPLLNLQEVTALMRGGRAHVTVKTVPGINFSVHQVAISSEVDTVHAEIRHHTFIELARMPGLKIVTLLFPGMSPFTALVSKDDPIARDYAVTIQYTNRPLDPIDFDGPDVD